MLSFKANFSLSSFTFIKRFFSFSLFSAVRVVSPAYLRLLIFLLAMLIPACASSSLAFHMMYSVRVKVKSLSRVRLCDPTDYTVQGILQARILEWVAFPFSRGSSQPWDRTQVSCIAGGFFTS
ncbi:unnamed protein product [Rangifer tarandus platyrhynchus]|uniref:Secreted protein n=1 Tax=Rangifer tarandus platyrhynchus TaxID=3082113 RepID=A0ABN8Z8V4_RANTA|nr:unnamed protein product [Rangifer tarandus platyrhynchus]